MISAPLCSSFVSTPVGAYSSSRCRHLESGGVADSAQSQSQRGREKRLLGAQSSRPKHNRRLDTRRTQSLAQRPARWQLETNIRALLHRSLSGRLADRTPQQTPARRSVLVKPAGQVRRSRSSQVRPAQAPSSRLGRPEVECQEDTSSFPTSPHLTEGRAHRAIFSRPLPSLVARHVPARRCYISNIIIVILARTRHRHHQQWQHQCRRKYWRSSIPISVG